MVSKFTERLKSLELKHYLIIVGAIIVFVGILIGIFNYRQNRLTFEIVIENPKEGETYYSDSVILDGMTEPGAKIMVENLETVADNTGYFVAEIPLNDKENVFVVKAEKNGINTEKTITVIKGEFEEPIAKMPKTTDESQYERLNNSGPETFWLGELALVSGSGMLWRASRKKLNRTISKS